MDAVNMYNLIEEIKQRPCLWDVCSIDYSDKIKRKFQWESICQNINVRYQEMTELEKFAVLKDLQLKWKSIRDCFQREMRYQQQIKNTPDLMKKKRPYIYFNRLKFLMTNYEEKDHPEIIETELTNNFSNSQISIKNETFQDYSEDTTQNGEQQNQDNTINSSPIQINNVNKNLSKPQKRSLDTFEENLLTLLQKRSKNCPITDDDGDKMFLLSQVPFFKKMPENVKLWARLEITRIVQKAIEFTYADNASFSPSVCLSPQFIDPSFAQEPGN